MIDTGPISFVLAKRIAMNVINEETAEFYEYKRQLRLQKRREQRRARLACETKEGFHFAVKRENVVSKVFGMKKKKH